jgi:toxin ParE1/3/4
MKPNPQILQHALNDLDEIVLYIAQNSKAAANKMRSLLVDKIRDLLDFPRRGRPIPDARLQQLGFRILFVKPYVIFYRLIGSQIIVYRIVHGASNYPLLYERLDSALLGDVETDEPQ